MHIGALMVASDPYFNGLNALRMFFADAVIE